VDHELVKLQRW